MNASPDIRAAMLAEAVRLTRRTAELRVTIGQAEKECDALERRGGALLTALKAWGDTTQIEADDYLIDHYVAGWPADQIADVVSDILAAEFDEAAVELRATEFGLSRPRGWSSARASEDYDAANTDGSDDWLRAAYGLPEFSDAAPPEPMKALPAPSTIHAPIQKTAEPTDAPADRDSRVGGYLAARWTPERTAIIERDWPTYRLTDAIVDEVNTLPGEKVWKDQVGNFANTTLRLHRPVDYRTRIRQERGERHAGWCTPERRAVLENDYPAAVAMRIIRDRLEEFPGAPLPSNATITSYAQVVLGLTRKIADQEAPDPLPTCVECGSPRSIGSAALCRKCYHANAEAKRATALANDASTTNPTTAAPISTKAEPAAVEMPTPHPLPLGEGVVADTPPPARGVVGKGIRTTDTLGEISTKPRQKPAQPPTASPRPNLGPSRWAAAMALPADDVLTEEPILADAATIRATVAAWGIVFRGKVDLWMVNQAARKRGQRPFELDERAPAATKKRNCLNCGKALTASVPAIGYAHRVGIGRLG